MHFEIIHYTLKNKLYMWTGERRPHKNHAATKRSDANLTERVTKFHTLIVEMCLRDPLKLFNSFWSD